MSRFVACISDCEETSFADLTYEFIQQKGELPSDEQLYNIIKQSHSLDNAFHQINQLFATKTKEALLNAVSVSQRRKIAEKLTVEFQQSTDSPADDNCTFQYGEYVVEVLDMDSLFSFYSYLETIERHNIKNAFFLDVSKQVSDAILDVVEEGVYLQAVDSSCGESETIIIELAFLQDMAKTNANTRKTLEKLSQILAESQVDLNAILHECKPYFLVLEVSFV